MPYVVLLTAFLGAALLGAGAAHAASPDADASRNSIRVSFAKSSETDLATVVVGDYDASPESNFIIDAAWGRRISKTLFGLPIEMTGNLGLQYLAERGYQDDGFGATAFIKAHYVWRLPLTDTRVRLGLGEGLSYVSRIPMSEQRDFAKKGVESEKLMNYLEWTIDLPLDQFLDASTSRRGGVEELSIGFIVWHRSSVFGVMAESGGGVNFMGFGVQARY